MKKDKKSESEILRQEAETLLNTSTTLSDTSKIDPPLSEIEMLRLIHELEVHQVELELQNDELQRAKADAETAKNKYTELYDFAPSGFFTLSKLGEIIELNLTTSKMLVRERSKLINIKFSLFVSTGSRSNFNLFLDKVFESKRQENCEVTLANEGDLPTHVFLSGIVDVNREFCNITMVDITERKQAEKQKQMLTDQLIQAQRMEAVGTLAGGIAHDFNNILAIIFGNAELALHDMSPENSIRHNMEEVLEASIRAKNLVRQILDFSRKDKTKLMPIHPQSLIKETLKLLSSTTPTTISINQDISEDCGAIMTDVTKFHQIIMNLFGNAIHAMNEKGEVTVSLKEVNLDSNDFSNFSIIAPHSLEIPGAFARLAVADTGAGINQEIIEQIFDPFFTTKQIGEGSGMGLSVVHGIVESQGGFITVESKEGQGSTFSVFIPITTKKEILKVEKNSLFQTGTERILLVDDEESILDVAQQMLEGLGYKVTIESSSDKALEIFKSNPDHFDLLITDQSMPKMSGAELIDEILKMRPEMPFVLCSGYSSKVSEENYKDKTSNMYLSKPYSKKTLSDAVRKVLASKLYLA